MRTLLARARCERLREAVRYDGEPGLGHSPGAKGKRPGRWWRTFFMLVSKAHY
jgi:hypothetical protein